MSFQAVTVDLRLGADGALIVQWSEAPGQARRLVPAEQVLRLLACMQAVHDAEQNQVAARMQVAWLAASRGLVELLDGPERALLRRVEAAEQQGQALLVAVRALADHQDALRAHPAARMLWQLLSLADLQACGRSRFAAVLQLGPRAPEQPQVLPHGGLRILCMAFSPQDVTPVLDYEGEEERFLEVLAPFVREGRAQVRVVEDGTLEELERALLVDTYDVVHLTGHGVMTPQGARLVMEDETGMRRRKADGSADVSPAELLAVLRRGAAMPQLVVLSNCHSAASGDATPSFAVELVAAGVPVVLGWTRPVRDDHATDAAGDLYQQLAAGKPLIEAVEFARDALREREQGSPQPGRTWMTLALVARAAAGFRVDRHAPQPIMVDARETYQFLAGGKMKVLARGFVGRRRPLQRLVRLLRDGQFADRDGTGARDVAGVIVWGMKGMGKSCLVARAVERVRQQTPDLGMVVLHGALDDLAVLEAFRQVALDQWGDLAAEQVLEQKELPVLQRIRRVLALWRTRPVALILDDFEQNLETRCDGPARLNGHAAALLDVLLPACKLGRPKLLITTAAMFELPAAHATALGELRLGELEMASVRKLWMRGPSANAYIPVALRHWETLAARLGNNARTLSWARDLLAGKTSEELADIAARAAALVPAWVPGDEVSQEKHDDLAQLFLFHMAHEAARADVGADAQAFLQRARVYEVAVPAEAFAGLLEGLSIDLGRHLVALANLGLLEVGELDGQRAYRVSPLVERQFTAERPALWHAIASRFWWGVAGPSFERVQRAWRHALAGRHRALAELAGRAIHSTLSTAGLYSENRQRAEEHLAALPDSPFGAHWAGEAELYGSGPTSRARELLEAAFRGLVDEHGTDRHPEVSASLHALGCMLRAQGDLPGARKALERSLAINAEVHGTDRHPSIAVGLHALGGVLRAQGDLPGARAALERALAIDAEVRGTDMHRSVAVGLQALGMVLEAQGALPDARVAFERALTIQTEVYGTEKHPDVAASLHALGNVLRAQGDLTGARLVIERSLAIKAEVHGTEEHPDVAASLHTLGMVLEAQGELVAARGALERALAIEVEAYGTDRHPSVATSLHALGSVLQAQGDLPSARAALEHSLAIDADVHGTDRHPAVAASLHALGCVLLAQGDFAGARVALERSLAIDAEVYGTEKHPFVAASLHALGSVFQVQGDLVGARVALERSLAIKAEVHGTEKHPDVAASLYVLSGVLRAQGDLTGARGALERALAIQAEVYGTDRHPSVAVSLHRLALVCLGEDKPNDAVVLLRRALSIEKHCFGPIEYHSAATEVSLAMVLGQLGQRDEAYELLAHAVPLLTATNPNHPVMRQLAALAPKRS